MRICVCAHLSTPVHVCVVMFRELQSEMLALSPVTWEVTCACPCCPYSITQFPLCPKPDIASCRETEMSPVILLQMLSKSYATRAPGHGCPVVWTPDCSSTTDKKELSTLAAGETMSEESFFTEGPRTPLAPLHRGGCSGGGFLLCFSRWAQSAGTGQILYSTYFPQFSAVFLLKSRACVSWIPPHSLFLQIPHNTTHKRTWKPL